MKKTVNFFLIFLCSVILFSCSYDDTEIWSEINKIKTDISSLKEQTNSLKSVVDALNAGKVITKVDALEDEKGFKITFNDGNSIEVLNGEKAPVIGIKESEGVYYWTITTNGTTEFLLDAGDNKIPVTGNKGQDGVTPELAINDQGYWTVNGSPITDSQGNPVEAQGDSFFTGITQNEESVTFTLADGNTIIIPKSAETYLYFDNLDNVQTFVLKPGENKRMRIVFNNIEQLEVSDYPSGWRVNLHRPDKYVNVSVPANAGFGVYELVLRGLDKKGLVFMAVAKISISSSEGFSDPFGAFILNEGNKTTENGSLIYIAPNGYVYDKVYSNMNGKDLGNATQDLFIKDGKMWIISQSGSVSATGTVFNNEGMLVVADVSTMKRTAVYDDVLKDGEGKYKLKWPTHLAVLNDENVFIRDNYGVSLFNSNTKELTLIPNTSGAAKNRMAVANDRVFVIKSRDLIVFEAGKKEIVHTINMGAAISGVLTSKDGNLWVSTTGSPNKITKIDSKTYEVVKENSVTTGSLGAGWGASPGITAKGDTIYYSNASTKIYRHIFSTNESKLMVDAKDFVQNATMAYNNIAVHPVSGDVYMNTIKGYGWDFTINNISVFNFDEDIPSVLKANYTDYTRYPVGIFFTADFK